MEMPHLSLLEHLQREKQRMRNPNLILPKRSCISPFYGIYDKKLLPLIIEALKHSSSMENVFRLACCAEPEYQQQIPNFHPIE
jgi:hypothetical protein